MIYDALRQWFASRRSPAIQPVQINGRTLWLRRGVFRETSDYDDAWLLACARHASVFWDVGANVGYDSTLALVAGTVRSAVLVEANPAALCIAADGVIRNGMANRARFVHAFAGDRDGAEAQFWTTGSGAAGSMYASHARTASALGASIRVPTISLDALSERLDSHPDLVKIDVEGAEGLVLRGAVSMARRGVRFLVEMHSNPDLPMLENARRVLEWCTDQMYSPYYLKRHARLTTPDEIGHRGRCHLLLQPSGWEYPDWLRGIEQGASILALPATAPA